MEPQWLFFLRVQLMRQTGLAVLQIGHLCLHARMIHAFGDRRDNLINLADDCCRFLFLAVPSLCGLTHQIVILLLIFRDESGDQIGVHKLVAQAGQHLPFKVCALHRQPVVAGAFGAGIGTTVEYLAHQNVSAVAAPTGD